MTAPVSSIADRLKSAPLRSAGPRAAKRSKGEDDISEHDVAQAWVASVGENWRYDHTEGAWFKFNGAIWRRDATLEAFESIGALAVAMGGTSKSAGKAGFARGAEAYAKASREVAVEASVWNPDDFLLGTPGGVVDLRTGRMIPAQPTQMITRSCAVKPTAGVPTRWLRFLDEATGGDPGLVRYLQQVLGHCLTGDTSEHALFFVYGAGKNGKSVWLNTASKLLADYHRTAAMDTFAQKKGDSHPTELARLAGPRMVTASETEEGRKWAEARIKQLTGGDRIAARFMRQDFFEFDPKFKLVIVGNHKPALHSVDPATRRRFNIIPFTHTPAVPDTDLESKLWSEGPQILQWMIQGCLDWQSNGFQRPEVVEAATEDYFDEQDMLGQWVAEKCETGQGKWDTPAKLFGSWSAFARENGEECGTAKSFGSVLEKRGFARGKTGGIRRHAGIAVVCDAYEVGR